jgi:serine-type D-Ala-D-Ala carboxypeptidase (penicillin-binding protein 5/6)
VDPAAARRDPLLGVVAPAFAVVRPTDTLGDMAVSDMPEESASKAPDLDAAAGVLMASDGRILWSRSPDEERAMASTTKIMTAIVALENASLDEPILVSPRAATIGEAAARLKAGETYPLRTLLEAMLVKSGNDASIAVAEHIGGSVEGFAAMMNDKAAQLGLEHTSFVNPHGLDAPGHYTSAADLATLARYAMANDEFRRMVALESVVIDGERRGRRNSRTAICSSARWRARPASRPAGRAAPDTPWSARPSAGVSSSSP